MSSHPEKIRDLIFRSRDLGYTLEAVATLEEAVRLADSHKDVPLGYQARQALLDAATYSGEHDKGLVAFSWCLAQADKSPEDYSIWELLWKYKWVIDHLVQFPRISRERIYAALDDFSSRCRQNGFNDRAAVLLRCNTEAEMGNFAAAKEWRDKWQLTKRDGMADCHACELDRVVKIDALMGEHEAAIQAAGPILRGRLRCAEVPHLTYSTLLRSFWEARGPEEAGKIYEKGYRLVRGSRDFIREHARHILHLLRADRLDQAVTLVRRHLSWALETRNPDDQYFFLVATRVVMRRVHGQGTKSVRLRLRNELCPVAGKTTVAVPPFLEWLDGKIEKLASEFDSRNGNQWFGNMARSPDPVI